MVNYPTPSKFLTPSPDTDAIFRKFPTPDSDLSKISIFQLRLLNIQVMKFGCKSQWKSWFTARNICFNKSFKRNCTISKGIPNLGLSCEKLSNWAPGARQKNPTPIASVVRNPSPTPSLRLRLRKPVADTALLSFSTYKGLFLQFLDSVCNV